MTHSLTSIRRSGQLGDKAAAIAKALGGRSLGRGRWLVCCPVHNDRNPSLIISDAPNLEDNISVHCFAGCDWREVKRKLAPLGLRNNPPSLLPKTSRAVNTHSRDMGTWATTLWAQACQPTCTPMVVYLASRGLHLPS